MKTNNEKSVIDQMLLACLRRYLKDDKAEFRPKQLKIIRRIVSGRDTLAILPTGAGKSACYVVPGLCMEGLTIVVTPLIALMRDQVMRLHAAGIPAACLGGFNFDGKNTLTEESETRRSFERRVYLEASRGSFKFLYVTPERFKTGKFLRFANHTKIRQVAVDEAHCVSLWGYEFRPVYLSIGKTISRFAHRPVISAFTATAAPSVQQDIIELLGMNEKVKREKHVTRNNLNLRIQYIKSNRTRTTELLAFLGSHEGMSGIIYFYSKDALNHVYDFLAAKGFSIARYYADLAPEEKDREYRAFVETGEKKIMLATCAFGMGVDKKDIRFVVHYDIPPSIENYYQETGRAGRDGKNADCLMFCRLSGTGKEDSPFHIRTKFSDPALPQELFTGQELRVLKERAQNRAAEMTQLCLAYGGTAESALSESEKNAWLHEKIGKYFRRSDADHLNEELVRIDRSVYRRIDNLYANRTALAREIREYTIKTKTPQSGQEIRIEVDLGLKGRNADGKVSYVLSEPLSFFDLMLADAVYTLESCQVKTIYAANVAAVLSGDPGIRLKSDRKQAIEEALLRMSAARITIQYDPKHGFCYTPEERSGKLSGPFLPLKKADRGGFVWSEKPPLYRYAEIMNGEFYVIPENLLCTRGESGAKAPSSLRNLTLTYCLLTRLLMIRTRPSDSKRATVSRMIRYDYLFDRVYHDVSIPDTRERNRLMRTLRKKTGEILTGITSCGGRLKGYEEYGSDPKEPVGVILQF